MTYVGVHEIIFPMKKLLFISGSLRKDSYNTALLKEAEKILNESLNCSFLSYSEIPYMNQDIEFDEIPSVKRVRKEVEDSDAIWIGTPEYNHSYSGVLKNLMDWLSRPLAAGDYSTSVIRGKKVAISSVAGSSSGSFAREKLKEMLHLFSCTVCEKEIGISLGKRFSDAALILTEEEKRNLKMECQALLDMLD